MKTDYHYSTIVRPHSSRTHEMLTKYPEIKKLMVRNRFSAVFIVMIVGIQLGIGSSISIYQPSWWIILSLAYLVGAVANHALFALIHECVHGLVFKNRNLNLWFSILCDLPNAFPTAVSFRKYHIKHHIHQGHYDQDVDIASNWEAEMAGNSSMGKAFWLSLFALWQALRPGRMNKIKLFDRATLISAIFIFTFDIWVFWFWGPECLIYFILSMVFSVGLHPMGARKIQQHFIFHPPQETYSYYGWLNFVSFNIGYHVEHHDFPGIPWNHMPKLKKIAPEFYNSLHSHKSWTMILFKFIFDPRMTLYDRMLRTYEDKVPPNEFN